MAETKALSPEVQELLEKIQKQAELYDEALEYFETQQKEFDNIKFMLDVKEKDFTAYFESLKKSIEDFKNKNSDTIERTIKNFTEELNKIKDINENVRKVNEFKQVLEKDIDKINKEFANFRKSFNQLATDSASQIEVTTKEIQKELTTELNKLKNDIDTIIAGVRNDLNNKIEDIENFAKMLKVQQNDNIEKLTFEILTLNKRIDKENNRFDEYLTKIRDEIKDNYNKLMNKFSDFKYEIIDSGYDKIVEQLRDELKSKFMTKEEFKAERASYDIDVFGIIDNMKEEIKVLEDSLNKTQQKFNMTLFVAIASIIGIILLFIMYLSNA